MFFLRTKTNRACAVVDGEGLNIAKPVHIICSYMYTKMNVCVLSELSMLFKAIVSRCSDLPGVHFTQLELENEGEHSRPKRDPHWVGSLGL